MPSYDVIVNLDISFPGGSAKGNGNGQQPTYGHGAGGAGYEIQIIRVTCKIGCSDVTVKKLAITEARKNIVAVSAKYNFVAKGMVVKTLSATITARTP